MTKTRHKFIRIISLIAIVGIGLSSLVACGGSDGKSVSDDGTGTIHIYNNDNKDYRVELRRASDDVVLGDLDLDDIGPFDDWIARFEDVPEDIYYLVIFINNTEVDRSSNFTIDEDELECYRVDDGRFESC